MHPEELKNLIQKYRRHGLLVDSNLLLLYFIGSCNRDLISKFKRTIEYTLQDYDYLQWLIGSFQVIYTTPNILTEVSNLSKSIGKNIRSGYYEEFARRLAVMKEEYVESAGVCGDDALWRIGLTDAVIAKLAPERCLAITVDVDLYTLLQDRRIDVINFNHIRPF